MEGIKKGAMHNGAWRSCFDLLCDAFDEPRSSAMANKMDACPALLGHGLAKTGALYPSVDQCRVWCKSRSCLLPNVRISQPIATRTLLDRCGHGSNPRDVGCISLRLPSMCDNNQAVHVRRFNWC